MRWSEGAGKHREITYISCTEGGKIVTGCHEDQTQGSGDCHEEETFSSAPNVQDLCQWNEDCGRDCVRYDIDHVEQGMACKVARHEGQEAGEYG